MAELFGEAFVEVGDVETGMQWYERAVAAPDGRASMGAVEQLANARTRLGWQIVDTAKREVDALQQQEKRRGQSARARAAARRARIDAERSLRKAVARADRLIDQSLALLAKLLAVEPTLDRARSIGLAYKRRALVDAAVARRARRTSTGVPRTDVDPGFGRSTKRQRQKRRRQNASDGVRKGK